MWTRIAQNKARLVRAYRTVRQAAPDARVYVHGYPQFIEAVGGNCANNVRLNDQERQFAAEATRYLNEVIRAAAREAGVFYVDVENILVGRKLCSQPSDGKLYVNGVTAGNDTNPLEGTLLFGAEVKNGICLRACIGGESYHPLPAAHELYTDALLALTDNFQSVMPEPVSTVLPSPDDFFGAIASQAVSGISSLQGDIPRLVYDESMVMGADYYAGTIDIELEGYLPGSEVELWFESDPVSLGTFVVDADGRVMTTVPLPADAEPGYHEVRAAGFDEYGAPQDTYKSIVFASAPNDFDGDGVPDWSDSCQGIVDSGIDADGDAVDDACDTDVSEDEDSSADDENEDTNKPQKNCTVVKKHRPHKRKRIKTCFWEVLRGEYTVRKKLRVVTVKRWHPKIEQPVKVKRRKLRVTTYKDDQESARKGYENKKRGRACISR